MIATMPATHSSDEESNETYQFFGPKVLTPLIPAILGLEIWVHVHIASHIRARVEGTLCGIILGTVDHPIASHI